MLRHESELFCIPAAEPEIVEVHRSTDPVRLGSGTATDAEGDVFVCHCKKESGPQTFIALHLNRIRRVLVYSVSGGISGAGSDSLEKALEFVAALGFTMESLRLEYGQAMREVIIRQVPVLLAPEKAEQEKRKRLAELADLEQRVAANPEEMPSVERQQAARKLAIEQCRAAEAEAVRKAVEECLFPLNAPAAIAASEEEARHMAAEKAAAEARCRELEKEVRRLNIESAAAEKAHQRVEALEREVAEQLKTIETLLRRIDEIEAEKSATIAGMQDALGTAQRQLDSERKSSALFKAEMEKRFDEMEAQLSAARAETARVRAARDEHRNALTAAEKRMAALEEEAGEAERRVAERLNESEAGLAEAREERAREGLEKRSADLEAALRQMNDQEKSARQKEAEHACRVSELEQALGKLGEELDAERFERELLVREKGLIEQQLSELAGGRRSQKGMEGQGQAPASAEAEERIASLSDALAQAEEKVTFLSEELERMAASREPAAEKVAAPRSEHAPAVKRLAPISPGPLSMLKTSPTAEATTPPPHVVRRPPRRGAFFHVDWDRTRIEYDHPDEILEVYQPPGMIQLSLEGYPNQYCSAYIVTCKKDKSRQVHIAFGLAESARTLIYSPAKALRNRSDYDKAFREAFKYLKVVGFNPEPVPLGSSTETRMKALENISVLRGPLGSAQGF